MPTLTELVAMRRAKIEAFKAATPDHLERFQKFDISPLNDAIERTPVASKADALAALDLIRDEAAEEEQDLVLSMVSALRKYLAALA